MSKKQKGKKGKQQGDDLVPPSRTASLKIDHRVLVNDRTYADLFFILADRKEIAAHKAIMCVRAPNCMSQGVKKKRDKKNVTHLELDPSLPINEETLLRSLEYCYSGEVNFETLTPSLAIRMIAVAVVYGLKHFEQVLRKYLQARLNHDNIFGLLREANDLKVASAKEVLMDYAYKNPVILGNTEGVNILGIGLFQEVVVLQQKQPQKLADVLEVTESENSSKHFRHLYDLERKNSADIQFRIEGKLILCHKCIFASASPQVASILLQDPQGDAKKGGLEYILPVPGFTSDAFECLLKWIYYRDTNVKPAASTQLIKFCKGFNMPELKQVCENVVVDNIQTSTVLSILEVAYNPVMEDNPILRKRLKHNATKFFTQNFYNIDLTPIGTMPLAIAADLLKALQEDGKNGRSSGSSLGSEPSGKSIKTRRSAVNMTGQPSPPGHAPPAPSHQPPPPAARPALPVSPSPAAVMAYPTSSETESTGGGWQPVRPSAPQTPQTHVPAAPPSTLPSEAPGTMRKGKKGKKEKKVKEGKKGKKNKK
mmetsp:Transcript_7129/g.7824  ORF Transcript_7129/g.7824 Transcript_7129/m.7824 type:complete len:539 (+) Transcript_7129:58-1674(+)